MSNAHSKNILYEEWQTNTKKVPLTPEGPWESRPSSEISSSQNHPRCDGLKISELPISLSILQQARYSLPRSQMVKGGNTFLTTWEPNITGLHVETTAV